MPPGGQPNAVSDVGLGGFPLDGTSYAILSSGDARHADPTVGGGEDEDGGPPSHGGNAQDVTVLRVDVVASAAVNCLSVGFRFLSDEAQSDDFNDGFIAELDASDWTADPSTGTITAPHNFAFDANHAVISGQLAGPGELLGRSGGGHRLQPRHAAPQRGADHRPRPPFRVPVDLRPGRSARGLGRLRRPPRAARRAARRLYRRRADRQLPGSPQPVRGKSVTVGVVSGKVRFKRRGSSRYEELDGIEGIPVGSTVDATAGRVRLTSAAGGGAAQAGKTQTAEFYKGSFVVEQGKGSALTDLKLAGPSLASCHFKPVRASAKRKKKPVRRLFGDGKGSFRTSGRHAAATVRGTKWLTQDTCAGTLVKVLRGRVSVRDFTRKRTVTVRAGKSYLARPSR